jgi:hypothetical protein
MNAIRQEQQQQKRDNARRLKDEADAAYRAFRQSARHDAAERKESYRAFLAAESAKRAERRILFERHMEGIRRAYHDGDSEKQNNIIAALAGVYGKNG